MATVKTSGRDYFKGKENEALRWLGRFLMQCSHQDFCTAAVLLCYEKDVLIRIHLSLYRLKRNNLVREIVL